MDNDGQTINLSQGDLYSYTVLMNLNKCVSWSNQINYVNLCFMISAAQLLFVSIYFIRTRTQEGIQSIIMYYDFGIKLLCCFFLHLMISSDLKQTVELMSYLKNPTVTEHVTQKRFLSFFLLQVRYGTAIAIELIHMFALANIKE